MRCSFSLRYGYHITYGLAIYRTEEWRLFKILERNLFFAMA